MSSTSSAALVDSASDLSEQECAPSRSAKSTHSVSACSPLTGQASLFTETSDASAGEMSERALISSVAGTHASRIQLPAIETALETIEIWRRKCSELCASLNRPGLLPRTSRAISISGWTPCVMDWSVRATPSGRLVYQLQLVDYLPWNGICGLLPRPQASDSKGAGKSRYRLSKMERKNFREVIREAQTDGIYPKPDFVEWVKGFPIGWTDLELSETRCPRNSPNCSGEQS